ncbi:MAG: hypothetical protein IKX89_06740 [Firmicutes bacterium]|nr:hypothetical protein [Bacillota bacterium]
MLIKENNEYGVITLNDALISQIMAEAIKPWSAKARYAGERQVRFSDAGLYVYAGISIRIGTSISETAKGIIDGIENAVTEMLEIPIEDIVIEVVQMTTSRNTVERSIVFSARGGKDGQVG